jgi:alkylhydroperoxidase AhpD family core domain
MSEHVYPPQSHELSKKRRDLAPEIDQAFRAFSKQVFSDGALSSKVKQLIALAVAHVTQCPYCIRAHTQAALKAGASQKEIIEAIWVGAEMRAGAAYAHMVVAMDSLTELEASGALPQVDT